MAQTNAEKLLQRPLYIFDLPEEILYSLEIKSGGNAEAPQEVLDSTSKTAPNSSSHDPGKADGISTTPTSCNLCGLSFRTVLDQRSHARSDLHRFNLKQRLHGKQVVDEAHFERLVGDLDESLSGSDSSESEDSTDGEANGASKTKDSTLSALLKRQARLNDDVADDAPAKATRGSGKPPLLWFATSKLPKNTSLGVYRAIFSQHEQEHETSLVETIQKKQLAPQAQPKKPPQPKHDDDDDGGVALPKSMIQSVPTADGPTYFLCMIGGGHFAAMLVSLAPRITKKGGQDDRSATVIAHKTFHRYTTRRKQGGSQSANDNSKGNAHSAGSSLRRYNETALTEEVRALLAEWKAFIDKAELLFIRATGTTNRRTLFGPYEGQVLNQRDERLRGFPFSTRRATQSELMRSFIELTRVKVETIDEAELARRAEAEKAAIAVSQSSTKAPSTSSPKSTPKSSKADEEALHHTTQLQALIRRSKAPALLTYLQSNSLHPTFQFYPADQNRHAPTPLHLAASINSPACITALLTKASSDPTLRNADSKSAFDLAGDRATRDAFRLARAQLGEERWAWDEAGVPAALSQADVDVRTAQEKKEKKAEEEAEKARKLGEAERLRREDERRVEVGREARLGKGRLLEGKVMTAEERRAEEGRGMSEEVRLRVEREKRARAAEERMKRLQGK